MASRCVRSAVAETRAAGCGGSVCVPPGRYLAHGTDWGAGVTAWIALDQPESVEAIHLGYLLTRPDTVPESTAERELKSAYDAQQEKFGAYSRLQETKPLSLAYATAGNPVGQLAWIVERFHDWADLRERRFEEVFSMDQLLTNAMLYILTGTFDTAAQYYADAESSGPDRPRRAAAWKSPPLSAPTPHLPSRTRRANGPSGPTTSHAGGTCHEAATSPRWRFFVEDLRDWAREIS
jgi:hypothetical protein